MPILGGLALVGEEEAAAKDRRRRRKARHRRRTGKHKHDRKRKKKRCTAARLCAGQCGTVKKKRCKPVDRGSCACTPPCPVCQTCNATTTRCVPNTAVEGQACGGPGEQCVQGACVQTCTGLFPTDDLQTAINAAPPNTTLTLCPGTWTLTATVNIGKTLTLRGAGAELTVLDGGMPCACSRSPRAPR